MFEEIDKDNTSGELIAGIAWYDRAQFQQLQQYAVDADLLHDSYDDWRKSANEAMALQVQNGIKVKKVAMKISKVMQWCEQQGKPFDANARTVYVTEYLKTLPFMKKKSV